LLLGVDELIPVGSLSSMRSKLLRECFAKIQQAINYEFTRLKLPSRLTAEELSYISFACHTLESRKNLDQIATEVNALHAEIKAMAKPTIAELSPAETFRAESLIMLKNAYLPAKTSQAIVVAPKKKKYKISSLINAFIKSKRPSANPEKLVKKSTNITSAAPSIAQHKIKTDAEAIKNYILSVYSIYIGDNHLLSIDSSIDSSYGTNIIEYLTKDTTYWKNADQDDIIFSIGQFANNLAKDSDFCAKLIDILKNEQDPIPGFLKLLAAKISDLDSKSFLEQNLSIYEVLLRIHEHYVAKPVSLDEVVVPPEPVVFSSPKKTQKVPGNLAQEINHKTEPKQEKPKTAQAKTAEAKIEEPKSTSEQSTAKPLSAVQQRIAELNKKR